MSSKIRKSNLRYPQSNGFTEKLVGTAKNLLKKVGPENIFKALAEYRYTSVSGMRVLSREIILSRKLRMMLPITQTDTVLL